MLFWLLPIVVLLIVLIALLYQHKRIAINLEKAKVERLRRCPMCAERVQMRARFCRYCHTELSDITDDERICIEADYQARLTALDYEPSLKEKIRRFTLKIKSDWEQGT